MCEKYVKEKTEEGVAVRLVCMGKKGRDFFRARKEVITDEYLGVVGARFGFNVAINAGRGLIDGFLEGEADEVHMIFSEFVSMARQAPTLQQLLPITSVEKAENSEEQDDTGYIAEHICEPSVEELMEVMLPKQIYVQLYKGLLETSTSEHAARMTAMDNATKACKEMVEDLTLAYNKARQAAITADLMDIVGGAEALKG
jgi:F-type H+-transporting ATPase subunit gamma